MTQSSSLSSNTTTNNNTTISTSNTTATSNSIFGIPEQTRLVTIIAHVDHGKTTIADTLIESNGIISERLAGTIRYLDSDPEEQRRGITIKTSAIALQYNYYSTNPNANANNNNQQQQQQQLQNTITDDKQQQSQSQQQKQQSQLPKRMIIHLLDSPGHADFCYEVSTAVTLCDSALVIIDVVEGMGSRSHQVLREAYKNNLIPILIINKIDKLYSELYLSPYEAYVQIRTLIESVNAAAATIISASRTIQQQQQQQQKLQNQNQQLYQQRTELDIDEKQQQKQQEQEELIWTFDPIVGNVIFASALYGYGFTVQTLTKSLYKSKITTIKPIVLKKFIFGDYKFNTDKTKIIKCKQYNQNHNQHQHQHHNQQYDDNDDEPIFVTYGLRPLWKIYEGITIAASSSLSMNNNNNNGKDIKIHANTIGMDIVLETIQIGHTTTTASTGTTTNTNNSNNQYNPNLQIIPTTVEELQILLMRTGSNTSDSILRCILRRYRPLADCILNTICDIGPSPKQSCTKIQLQEYPTTICSLGIAIANDSNVVKVEEIQDETTTTTITKVDTIQQNEYNRIVRDVQSCNINNDSITVAHICKFISTEKIHIRDPTLMDFLKQNSEIHNDDNTTTTTGTSTNYSSTSKNIILGVARVLSGVLRTGNDYYVMEDDYKPQPQEQQQIIVPVKRTVRLFLLMGSSFVHVPEVPAGHICAIYYNIINSSSYNHTNYGKNINEIDDNTNGTRHRRNNGIVTLCDSQYGMPIKTIDNRVRPLVKVNIEPVHSTDMNILERGLQKLSLVDTSVEITTTSKGEHVLACLGEVHLEQTILDLQRTYCDNSDIKLHISDPIVDFAETTTWFTELNHNNNNSNNNSTNNNNNNSTAATYSISELDYTSFLNDTTSLPLRQQLIPPYNEEDGIQLARHGRCRAILSGRCATIWIRVVPLAETIYKLLLAPTNSITTIDDETKLEVLQLGKALNYCQDITDNNAIDLVIQTLRKSLTATDVNGNAMIEGHGVQNGKLVRGCESDEVYVPPSNNNSTKATKQVYSTKGDDENDFDDDIDQSIQNVISSSKNMYHDLTSSLKECTLQSTTQNGDSKHNTSEDNNNNPINTAAFNIWTSEMRGSVTAGFQLALRAGPVCEEPIHNVLVVVECVEICFEKNTIDDTYKVSKPLSGGMVVSSIRSGIRCSLLSRPIRLMEGHLKLTIHSSLNAIGSLYSVLSKRRGKVLDDSIVDGTDLLLITASIPQVEAYGLAPELFNKTSGEVTAPEMIFSHWEQLDIDPFWIPTTNDEREDYGEIQVAGDVSTGITNNALSYIRTIRKRKGLMIDTSRTVISAEKQRTMKR